MSIQSQLALLVALTGVVLAQQTPDRPASGVRVQFSVTPEIVTEHQPVWVTATFLNNLAEPVRIDLGTNRKANVHVRVVGEHGSLPSEEGPPQRGGSFGPMPEIQLQPQEQWRTRIVLNERFRSLPAGRYSVAVAFRGEVHTSAESGVSQAEQVFAIQVLPRDVGDLARVCGELARALDDDPDFATSNENATALSYVDDPVAVPYLSSSLSRHRIVAQPLVAGLERIGDSEAVEALIAHLDTRDSTLDAFVRTALYSLMAKTRRKDLRDRIRAALDEHRGAATATPR